MLMTPFQHASEINPTRRNGDRVKKSILHRFQVDNNSAHRIFTTRTPDVTAPLDQGS
jgi:hypothetical protein